MQSLPQFDAKFYSPVNMHIERPYKNNTAVLLRPPVILFFLGIVQHKYYLYPNNNVPGYPKRVNKKKSKNIAYAGSHPTTPNRGIFLNSSYLRINCPTKETEEDAVIDFLVTGLSFFCVRTVVTLRLWPILA